MNDCSPSPEGPPNVTVSGKPRRALLGLDTAGLEALSREMGQPAYRGRQLADWLYRKRATSLEAMGNLPRAFRDSLEAAATVGAPRVLHVTEAPDRTTKFLLAMDDGARVETVLLPYPDRSTVCVSTQVGCAAGCVFCATATMGFTRNLTAGEMTGQVLAGSSALEKASWRDELNPAGRRVSHVVFMGMGEPMWNLANVVAAVRLLNEEVGIGMRNITISTVGIPDAMRELGTRRLQLTLAVSLHAGTEATRRALVPTARKHTMDEVLGAARDYFGLTGRRVTYEYVVLGGVNDTETEARALADRLKGEPAHVNLIPWNPALSKQRFGPPLAADIRRFRAILEEAGVVVTQRFERGAGIAAACGQLAVSEPGAA
jgi:23S rRNA (adenine2503-C2)-methyltransferase